MTQATFQELLDQFCPQMGHTMLQVHDSLEVVAGIHALGFPQCIRALDKTHILVTCPPYGNCPYYSWWGFHSIMLQAIVNHQGTFTNVKGFHIITCQFFFEIFTSDLFLLGWSQVHQVAEYLLSDQ
ncbi:hypothetical protein Y1Q_0002863 [Alligator mississippiensis]|uniref:DDE Tnp4 domain-containing protein n=1 Tax=Alligator mississippiensis TaxID=8496 RepID=A0A151P025_ALLMI|nr:hypothetical protein Y1Q_0002863 [Alligator mississippiensis]